MERVCSSSGQSLLDTPFECMCVRLDSHPSLPSLRSTAKHNYYHKTSMKATTLSAALGAAALALLSFSASTAMLLDTPALGQQQHQMFQYLDAARQGEQGQKGMYERFR
jgi:hypothetical protein